jgi:hypothetical protein
MADIKWAKAVSGSFITPADWTGGVAPGGNDIADLDPAGPAYTVAFTGVQALAGLDLAANATLEVGVSAFRPPTTTLTVGGSTVNAGTITVEDQATITLSGTLSGGGEIVCEPSSPPFILGPFTNLNNTIIGGYIGNWSPGDAPESFVNAAQGLIVSIGTFGTRIDTGATVANAGVIRAQGAGGMVIDDAVDNTGLLIASRTEFAVFGAVTGAGRIELVGENSEMFFDSTIAENVYFIGAGGKLVLSKSQAYMGIVDGFSATGTTSFVLTDIAFKSAGEATFASDKNHTGGVLTVTDGTHTAHIRMLGNFSGVTFTCSDLGGDTVIVAGSASASQFAAAAAAFEAPAGTMTSEITLEPAGRLIAMPRS